MNIRKVNLVVMSLSFGQISEHAISLGASDIHLSPNMPPMLRIDGVLKEIRVANQTSSDIKSLLASIMTDEQDRLLKEELELNFIYEAPSKIRYRVSIFTAMEGLSSTLRIIPSSIPTFSDLGSPYAIKSLTNLENGLIVISGGLGSGKSTTLAAMVDDINKNSIRNIITIESSAEFIHKPIKSIVSQRRVGVDTRSYRLAIQSALLEDPDVIVIDDLKNPEIIMDAVRAASIDCLVLTTINANSTSNAIHNILAPFKTELNNLFASSLSAIINQRLIPKAIGHGRVAAYEIMPGTTNTCKMIIDNKISEIQSAIKSMASEGAISMEDYIQNLVICGSIKEDQRYSKFWANRVISSDDAEF